MDLFVAFRGRAHRSMHCCGIAASPPDGRPDRSRFPAGAGACRQLVDNMEAASCMSLDMAHGFSLPPRRSTMISWALIDRVASLERRCATA